MKKATLELEYLNGDGKPVTAPHFKDIRLTKPSSELCTEALEKAQVLPKKIKNDGEYKLYDNGWVALRKVIKDLELLLMTDKSPWATIAKQITDAVQASLMPLEHEAARIKAAMESYQDMIRRGADAEAERLRRNAAEKEIVAKHEADPVKKEKVLKEATQIREEAKKVKPRPIAGSAVKLYWEPHLDDAMIVHKQHPKFVSCDLNHAEIQKFLKDLEAQGVTIKSSTIPGITLIPKTAIAYRGKLE